MSFSYGVEFLEFVDDVFFKVCGEKEDLVGEYLHGASDDGNDGNQKDRSGSFQFTSLPPSLTSKTVPTCLFQIDIEKVPSCSIFKMCQNSAHRCQIEIHCSEI